MCGKEETTFQTTPLTIWVFHDDVRRIVNQNNSFLKLLFKGLQKINYRILAGNIRCSYLTLNYKIIEVCKRIRFLRILKSFHSEGIIHSTLTNII